MSIEKKSLISTLKTTKKANVASAPVAHDGLNKSDVTKKARFSMKKLSRMKTTKTRYIG